MNKCIGVISYTPNDTRKEKAISLLSQCKELFNLPIIVIAQCWSDDMIKRMPCCNMTIYKYKKPLGIVGARKALQKAFVESKFETLIMLDDDLLLKGNVASFKRYLAQIDEHPECYCIFKPLLLWLFAIPKSIYSRISFPDGDPVRGDYFEDFWLLKVLEKLLPKNKHVFYDLPIDAIGNPSKDPDTTWYTWQNKQEMRTRTEWLVSKTSALES